jgi:hypothetical protein
MSSNPSALASISEHEENSPGWFSDALRWQQDQHNIALARQEQALAQNQARQDELTQLVHQLQAQLATPTIPSIQATSIPSAQEPMESKVANPIPFTGKVAEAREFLHKCELVFRVQPRSYPSDLAKITFVVTYLREAAFHWIQPTLELKADKPTPDWFLDWTLFRAKFLQDFGDADLIETSRRSLAKLKQTGSCTTYAIDFRRFTASLDMSDQSLRYAFYEGLKDDVKDRILSPLSPEFENFEALITTAIRWDSLLYNRRKQPPISISKPTTFTSFTPRNSAIPTGPTPMDVDATNSRPRGHLTDAEKLRRRTLGLCGYCGGAGHFAATCPLTANRRQHQLSALEYGTDALPSASVIPLPTSD